MNFPHFKQTLLLSVLISLTFTGILGYAEPLSKADESDKKDISGSVSAATTKQTIGKLSVDEVAEKINENTTIDNTLLVKVKDGVDANDVKNGLKDKISDTLKIDRKTIEDFDANDDQVVALQFQDKDKLREGYKIAANNDRVEIAQPNYRYKKQYIPNDTEFNNQWYLKDQASGTYAQSGWDAIGTKLGITCGDGNATAKRCGGETSVKIAVIDSGVNTSIADFSGAPIDAANSMRFYNNSGGSACPSGQTYVPANGLIIGWQFCQQIGSQFDEDGHGTGVASVIMAQDNAVGGVGIAHNTTLLPIALHNDTFNTFFISEAIKYAQNKGAKVINLSLGTPYYDGFLESTINTAVAAGVTIVAASGNCAVFSVSSCDWDGSGTQNQPEEANNTPMYPAAFANVIAVGASNYATTTGGVTRACYSNYGSYVDIVAPEGDSGTACRSSGGPSTSGVRVACGVVRSGCPTVDTYVSGVGTSYASPEVAGAVGLLLSVDSTLSISDIRNILFSGSIDIGATGFDQQFGAGLLNIQSLVGTFKTFTIKDFPNADANKGTFTNLITGDFNGDGKTDFIRQEKNGWDSDSLGTAQTWLSNGDGTFTIKDFPNADANKGTFTNLITGDFNGDGKTDFIRQEKNGWDSDSLGTAQTWLSNGDGTFTIKDFPNADANKGTYTNLITGDFNGDGKTDFIRQEKNGWDSDSLGTAQTWLLKP
jgi:Subtilase family/FG-GAP-like repeat